MSDRRSPQQLIDTSTLSISQINTTDVLSSLQTLFRTVTSGEEYNIDQVKAATGISNAMVKVLRFEFDVYKHFKGRSTQ